MGERVAVVGLMRFNLVLNESVEEHWRISRGSTLEKMRRDVLDPKRLGQRLRLARAMPIASLARQTDPDFRLCVLISTLLPQPYRAELAAIAGRHPFIELVDVPPEANLRRTCAGLVPPDAPCVTFRLDDDDAVGPNFIADLRTLATPGHEERVLSFVNGVQVERRGRKLAFQEVEYLNNAFGLSCYSRTGATIFDRGGHHDIDPAAIVAHPRPRAWLRSIHAQSDSASRFKPDAPSWAVRPALAAERLPEFEGVDFRALAADLAPIDWTYDLKQWWRWQRQKLRARMAA